MCKDLHQSTIDSETDSVQETRIVNVSITIEGDKQRDLSMVVGE